jgi:hypothetical protein
MKTNVIDFITLKPITEKELKALNTIETVSIIHVDGIFLFDGNLKDKDLPDFLFTALNAYEYGEDMIE